MWFLTVLVVSGGKFLHDNWSQDNSIRFWRYFCYPGIKRMCQCIVRLASYIDVDAHHVKSKNNVTALLLLFPPSILHGEEVQ